MPPTHPTKPPRQVTCLQVTEGVWKKKPLTTPFYGKDYTILKEEELSCSQEKVRNTEDSIPKNQRVYTDGHTEIKL